MAGRRKRSDGAWAATVGYGRLCDQKREGNVETVAVARGGLRASELGGGGRFHRPCERAMRDSIGRVSELTFDKALHAVVGLGSLSTMSLTLSNCHMTRGRRLEAITASTTSSAA